MEGTTVEAEARRLSVGPVDDGNENGNVLGLTEQQDLTPEPNQKKPCLFWLQDACLGCIARYWKGLLVMAILFSVGALFSAFLQDQIQDAVEYFKDAGPVGVLLFIVSFAGLLLIGVPATAMEIGAAFLFEEFYQIFLINTAAKNVAKVIGFLIGKYLVHDWVKKNLLDDTQPLTQALARLIKKAPLKYSTLWGFAYVPSWTQMYGLPVLGCPFTEYMLSNNISGLCYSVIWAFVGITARNTIDEVQEGENVDPVEVAGTVIGVVFLVVTVIVGGYYILQELKKMEQEELTQMERESAVVEERRESGPISEGDVLMLTPPTQFSV